MPDSITFNDICTIISLLCGLAGTIMGAIALWRTVLNDRVRIKVFGKLLNVTEIKDGTYADNKGPYMAWEILNLSNFPVTIKSVHHVAPGIGATCHDTRVQTVDGKFLPIRIESRDSVTLFREDQPLNPGKHDFGTISATTVANQTFNSDSPLVINYEHQDHTADNDPKREG